MKRQAMSLILAAAFLLGQNPVSAAAQQIDETGQDPCRHEEVEAFCEPLEDGVHLVSALCICGEETDCYEEDCLDEDGDCFCDLCEAEVPCLHGETDTVYEEGLKEHTHMAVVLCACGEEVDAVLEACCDEDADGLCDGCEAELEKPAAVGDADGDGSVTEADAKCVLYYVVGIADAIDADQADVDGDGMITAKDATCILRYCENLIDTFPVEA